MVCFFAASFLLFSAFAPAQKISYAFPEKSDINSIRFEILGRAGKGYLIYKNIAKDHFIVRYNSVLQLEKTIAMDYLPDRVIDMDFIPCKDGYLLIYQYQKNKVVHCMGLKIDSAGLPVHMPRELDSTSIGFFADNKIYATAYSENRKQILIYRRNIKNEIFKFSAVIFNNELMRSDSFAFETSIRKNEEYYGDCVITNSGDIAFTHEYHKADEDDVYDVNVCVRKTLSPQLMVNHVSLDNQWVSQPMLKADNLNRRLLINAFYREERNSRVKGIFSAFVGDDHVMSLGFNPFFETLNSIDNGYAYRNLKLDNLTPKQVLLKKSGGFIVVAEDTYTETYNNNNWNRNGFYSPYSNINDYYFNNNYYNAYRPYGGYNNYQSTRYSANDILIMSVDSVSRLEWNSIINKKQFATDGENHLSYATMNAGREIQFFFLANDAQKDIVSHQGLQSNGMLSRYPTLRGNELNVEFMPRLSKQTGAFEIVMPFLYLNKIGFAKIDYSTP